MNIILRYVVTLYLAGDLFLVAGYTLSGYDKPTIILAHLVASAFAVAARRSVE